VPRKKSPTSPDTSARPADAPTYLTIEEAAATARVPKATVYAWVGERRLPSYRPGKRVLIAQRDLLDFIARSARPAVPAQ
jgi:excisionase family DNA binding protein